jgi:chaperonin GroES
MRKIKILHNKLLVKRERIVKDTPEWLILPDTAKRKEIGTGQIVYGTPDLPEGTRVIFNKYAGTDVDLKEEDDYVVLDPRDVLATLEK